MMYHLEIELDLSIGEADKRKHAEYVKSGMSSDQAWRRVAQDILGNSGAQVQYAILNLS